MVTWLNLLVIDMVLYLFVIVISTMVPVFGIFPLLVSRGGVLMVYPILLCQFSFLTFFLFLGATSENLLGWIFIVFFLGSPVGFSMGVNS